MLFFDEMHKKDGKENMSYTPINIQEKLAKFQDQWAPKVI